MRSIHTWLLALAAGFALFAGAAAAQVTHRAYLDLDSNAATGCSIVTPAGTVSGIEARLTATVSGQPPIVTSVTRENCSGAAFGAPISQPAGYPVGVNIGVGGADVVEFATSLAGLGQGGPANITFVSQTATGADIVIANGVFLPGQAAAPTQPAIIPATGILGLLLLAGLVLWLARKHPGFGASMALLLLFGAGVVWAANFVTDGQIGDWVGVQPRATDANNDATSGEMTIEIVAVFAEAEGGNLFLRVDVRDAQNQPPVANTPAAATLNEDGTTTITLTGSDPEGATLTFAIATNPTRGTLGPITPVNATTATVVYTPTANQNGADSFTFTVNDGSSSSTPATASITITAVNDAPVVAPATFTVVENSPNGTVVGTATATDVDTGQTLTWSITAGNTGSAFAINTATGQITVATSAAVVGPSFALTVQATDNGVPVLSDSDTITINVTGVNDEPSFTAGPNQTATEDDPAVTVPNWATNILAGPADEAGQTLTFFVSNDNNALFSVQPAIAANGTLSYTLAPNANGVANVAVFLQDNGGTAGGGDDTSPTQNFTITVTAVNDTPSFALPAAPNQNVLQNSGAATVPSFATAISAGPADESGQALTFNVSNDNNALFSAQPAIAANGTLTFTPAAGAVGTATVTVTLSDNGVPVATSAAQTFVINVNIVNQAPTFNATVDPAASLEDGGAQVVPAFVQNINDGDASVVQTVSFNITGNTNAALFSAGPAIDASGQLTYTAAANANGTADITFVAVDDGGTANGGNNTSTPDTFTITVTAVNDVPAFTAGPNQNVLQDAGPQTVDPWATGLSPGPANEAGQTLSFNITNNTNAALFGAGPSVSPTGVLTFTPAAGAIGSATITLNVQDSGGVANGGVDTSATQTFTINVNNVNDAPTFNAPADPAAVLEDAGAVTLPAFITGIDDGDPPVVQNVSFNVTGNTNPTLFAVAPAIASDGTLTYTLAANANGTADITFVAMDDGGTAFGGDDTSNPDTFTISVTPVNDVPAFVAGPDQGVLQDSGPATIDPWATGLSPGPADEVGQTLTFSITNNTNAALFSAGPSVSPTGVLTFTPAAGAQGSADITLQVADNGGTANGGVDTSATQTFTITVNNVNDAPTFTSPADPAAVLEDAAPVSLAGFIAGIDDGDAGVTQNVTFNVTGNTNATLFAVAPAISSTGTLTYTLAANANGSADITFVAMDDGGTAFGGDDTSNPDTFTITVTPVNDEPSFLAGPNQTVLENAGAQTVNPWATALSTGPADESGQTLSFVVGNDNPTLFSAAPAVSSTGVLTYTPAAGLSGTATVTLNVQDSGGILNGGDDSSASQTFTITVTDINAAPSFTAGPNQTVNEDAGAQTVDPWATAIDDGDAGVTQTLTFNVTGNTNSALFSAGPSISPTGVLTYTPAANASGNATITLTLSDDGGTANGGDDLSDPQTFTITVNAVNDEPSFVAGGNQTVLEDAAAQTVPGWATSISAGPADEAGQTLTFGVSNDNNALFSVQPAVSASGELTYTPAANISGTATVTVMLSDNGGIANGGDDTSAGQTFTITVNGVNDAPSFVPGANQTVNEDAGAQTVNPWATAIDDGDSEVQVLTFNITSNSNPTLFSAGPSISPTGVLTYTPTANAFGVATLQVQLMDDGGTANGGTNVSGTFTFTITVNPVNDPPVAGDEAWQTYGNTELRLDLAAATTPHVIDTTGSATGVRHNDMDPVENHTTSVAGIVGCGDVTAPFNCTLASGAVVVMESDGKFSYTPGPADLTDTFEYTLQDAPPVGEGSPAQDVGQVTLTMVEMVWYVNGGAAAGGNGTSTAPLQNFTGITGAGGAGDSDDADDWIYVHNSAVSGGIELEAGQRLLGEAVALNLATALNGDPLVDLRAAGTRPTVNNGAGNAVSIGNALPREVRGLGLQGSANAIDISTTAALTGAAALLIDNNVINGAGAEGIDVNFNTTTTGRTVTISNNVWTVGGTHTGNAIDVANTNATAGTLRLTLNNNTDIVAGAAASGVFINGGAAVGPTVIEGLSSNTVHGNTGLFGMNLQRVIFDSSIASGFQVVAGGTTDIGTSGNRVGTSGLRLEDVRGDLSFTSLDIFNSNGTGLFITSTGVFNAGTSTGFRLVNLSNADSLVTTGGPGLNASNATITLNPTLYTVTGSSTFGLNLDAVAGTFSAAAGGSSIASPTAAGGTAFRINASSVNSTYNGTINATQGTGVSLTGNSGTMAFTGALTLSTGVNPAFVATGGGTVTSTSTASTLATSTNTALNVANTNIGAGGLAFQSISSNGAASGIILNTTGASGALTVSGAGGSCTAAVPTCSGGSVLASTGPGINLTSTRNVSLTRMRVSTGGDDGIRADGLVNFTFATGVVTGNGNAVTERGMELTNLSGTASITDSHVSGNAEDNIYILNTAGTLNPLNITGTGGVGSTCQINDTSTTVGNDGIIVQGHGSAAIVGTISGCRFDGNRGDHIQVVTDALAPTTDIDVVLSNNVMTADGGVTIPAGCTIGVNCGTDLGGSITINPSGGSVVDFDVVNHSIQGAVVSPVTVNMGTTSTATSTLRGTVSGTTIGSAASPDSGSSQGDGINVAMNRAGTTTVSLTGNTIRQYSNLAGINLAARDNMGTTTGALNVTATGNSIANPGTFASNGVTLSSGAAAGDNYEVCADIGGAGALANTVNGSGANGGTDLRVRHRFEATVRLPGYGGGQADITAVANYLIARNSVAPTASASVNTTAPFGGQFQGGGACPQP